MWTPSILIRISVIYNQSHHTHAHTQKPGDYYLKAHLLNSLSRMFASQPVGCCITNPPDLRRGCDVIANHMFSSYINAPVNSGGMQPETPTFLWLDLH